MPTYTEAIQYLDENHQRAQEKDIAGNNKYEAYLVEKGIFPTKEELANEEYAYDWFMALYYNQPQLLENPKVTQQFVTMILEAAMMAAASSDDDAMLYMIAAEVAKRSKK